MTHNAGSSPLRVLIVDDEPPARAKLRRLLTESEGVAVVGEADNGVAAVEAIRRLQPDVVFLDVQMPGLDGFGVVASIGPNAMPYTVFVTAFEQHAVRAFEVHAIDYLLKPLTPSRFATALARVRQEIVRDGDPTQAPTHSAALLALHEDLRVARYVDRLLLHTATRGVFVPVQRIDWVEADRNYLRIHVAGDEYLERGTIAALVERLDPAQFLRINRSQVVRLDAVREVQPWSHGDARIVLTSGQVLTWSRRFRATAKHHFALGD